ncbi:MAG: hypothetical protein ACE367_20370 [Acidimicrobiales bacterium]
MASARGWWKAVLAAAIAAMVGAWFRHREPEIVDEAAPGTAQWPPLNPLPGDDAASVPADAWVAPDDEGNCPLSHPVKVKEASGIHHVPGGFSYDRTRADRCYATGADAEADGFRAAKR